MNLTGQLLVLAQNEPQLRLLIDLVQEFIVLKDGQGRWLVTNKHVLKAYGLEEADYQGKTDLELAEISPAFKEAFTYNTRTDEMAWEKRSALQIEKSLRGPDGLLHTWEVVKTPVFDEKGQRQHLVIVSRNITERKKAEAALREREAKHRLIEENMKDIIMMFDRNGTTQYLSPSYKHVLGYSEDACIEKKAADILHMQDYPRLLQTLEEMIKNKSPEMKLEFRCREANGQFLWFEANCSSVFKENGDVDYVIVAARNIMERKKYEHHLKTLAYQDDLTNVPNRRFFMKQLVKEMATSDRNGTLLAFVYLDLDHFKEINDRLGHEAGDELLTQFVKRIQSRLRLTDTIARMGGDEFVIILPDLTSRQEADQLLESLSDCLNQPWKVKEKLLHTTSSIGVALYPQDAATIEELIGRADTALYKAKNQGRSQVQFHTPEDKPFDPVLSTGKNG